MTNQTSLRCLLTALVVWLLPALLCAQDAWPQFRGPDGRAVASSSPLPDRLDPGSAGLVWKTAIPGAGNSSPIISRGQVFVTTAYAGQELSSVRSYTSIGMLVLALIAAIAAFVQLSRSRSISDAGWLKGLEVVDRLIVIVAMVGFLGIAGVAFVDPSRFWAPGVPGDTWLVTGMAGLTGLFAAIGWFRPHSFARVPAALLLLVAGALLYLELPLNKHHQVYRLTVRLALVAPAVAGGLWHLMMYALFRRRDSTPVGGSGFAAAGSLTAMVAVLFVTCNFVTPAVGLARSIIALDFGTGELSWNKPLFVAPEERLHRRNSFATPTPSLSSDGDRILAFFGPGWACVDRDGNELWEGRDDKYLEQSHYGAVASPLAIGDEFVLCHDTERTALPYSYIMALDAKTGSKRWRIQPGYAHESYMTPLVMNIGGEPQLITVTFGLLVGYDPGSGDKLWQLEIPTWQHVPSLTCEGDLVFVSGGAHTKWTTAAVRVTGKGKQTKAEIVWQTRRNVPHSASPVYYDGMLFTVTDEGMLVCYDAKSGDRHWRQRLNGTYLSSLIAGDGKVYACSEEGDVVVVAAQKEFTELSRTSLGEQIHATPAVANGRILVRTKSSLYCFGVAK